MTLATLQGGARDLIGVDDDSLYVTSLYVTSPGVGNGGVTRISKVNGSTMNVVTAPAGGSAYAVHDTNVYWVEGGFPGAPSPPAGEVMRAPKTGAPSEVILDLGYANQVLSVAFDACNLYVVAKAPGYGIWGQELDSPPVTISADASAPAEDGAGDDASAGDTSTKDAYGDDAVSDPCLCDSGSPAIADRHPACARPVFR